MIVTLMKDELFDHNVECALISVVVRRLLNYITLLLISLLLQLLTNSLHDVGLLEENFPRAAVRMEMDLRRAQTWFRVRGRVPIEIKQLENYHT